MDFFGAQAQARRDSRLLGWAFAACVSTVVLVLGAAALAVLRVSMAVGRYPQPFESSLMAWCLQHPGVTVLTLLLLTAFVGGASLWRMLQLRSGGGYVARSLGGVRVDRSTHDPRRRRLHNVVEEMAIASGVPLPEVYVLEQEAGINAFAAGHTPDNAAVAVTRGALMHLNREQLQGVIAHEFSHILNGDMRISIRLLGMIFGLMAVAQAGRTLLRASRHADRAGVPAAVIGLLLAVVGYLGWLLARLLQAWISRRRESLADASAVQFTRNPEGLKEALVRVAAKGERRRYATTGMEQIAHMLFAHGARSLFATHPPLLQRLQALDASINADRLESLKRQAVKAWEAEESRQTALGPPSPTTPTSAAQPDRATDATAVDSNAAAQGATAHAAAAALPAAVAVPAAAALIAATAGDPAPRHLEQAVALRRALPQALRASAEDAEGAQAILLAVVTHADAATRERRLALIGSTLGQAMAVRADQLGEAVATLTPLLRLPTVLQLIPGLRALPAAARQQLMQLLRELMRMDGRLSVFEYALEKLALRALLAQEQPRAPHGRLSLADCKAELGILFAVLARCGARDDVQARQSYEAGLAPLLPRHRPAYAVIDDWVPLLDPALDRLCALRIAAKELLIEGLVRTIAHDALLAPAEAELLRAICGVLECPLPPVLPLP